MIVDDLLARNTWPGKNAIGKRIRFEHFTDRGFSEAWSEVVGVVDSIRHHSLSKELRGQVYIPYPQSSRTHLSYVARTGGDPLLLADKVRREVRALDKDLAVSKLRPMSFYFERAAAPATFTAVLAAVFGGLGLVLATVGVYSVISYSVSRRNHEMAVRMAVGAKPSDILRLVMREGLALIAGGIALGVGRAWLVTRYLQTLLFCVTALDPRTYVAAALLIAIVSAAACWRPARRAARGAAIDSLRIG